MGSSVFRGFFRLLLLSACFGALLLVDKVVDGRSIYQQDKHRKLEPNVKDTKDVCISPSCVLASASILQGLNTTADPCQDFFQYSCGGYLEERDPPASRFGEVSNDNMRIVRKLLAKKTNVFNGKESTAVRKAKDYYNACMNRTAVDEAGSQPLKELISLLGGWSLLEHDDIRTRSDPAMELRLADFKAVTPSASTEFLDTLVASHELALAPIFNMMVTVDDKNSSAHLISFQQEGLLLMSPDMYNNNDSSIFEAYVRLGTTIALLLKFGDHYNPEGEAELEYVEFAQQKMQEILAFETQLAQAYVPSDDLQDPEEVYHKMTVKQFSSLIPYLDISLYLNQMFNDTIPEDEYLIVYTPDYFTRINDILEATDESVIRDYIVWHTISYHLPYLSLEFRQAMQDFDDQFSGGSGGPLWWTCVGRTQNALGEVTGALFVNEHIPFDTKEEAEKLVQTIRQAFMDKVPQLDWMESATKVLALEKAQTMQDRVGWPEWSLDAEKLDAKLEKIMVDPYNQFQNILWMGRFIARNNLASRGRPVGKSGWSMSADTVNAYYNPSGNEMVFPAGILQPPFYSPTSPMAVNYGGIGVVMGHELTHGFDDSGRKYDSQGNLNDWWDDKSAKQYEKRAQCIEDQYDNYAVSDGLQIDGLLTLGENIADNGGARTAYSALKSWLKTKPGQAEQRFAGLQDFTPERLFFIGLAQVWCTERTPEETLLKILTDPHSPPQFRVSGMVSNMPEFSEAFKCPTGSPMNPNKECKVW